MQKVIRRRDAIVSPAFSSQLPGLLQRVYGARGVKQDEELQHHLTLLQKPSFKGLPEAVNLLADAVVAQEQPDQRAGAGVRSASARACRQSDAGCRARRAAVSSGDATTPCRPASRASAARSCRGSTPGVR